MSRRLPIRVVRTAADQILEASAWWKANRPKAPEAFREEIVRAFELVCAEPHIGARAENVKLAGVRRIHLSRIRYQLYYRVKTPPGIVEILAFWHASRGTGPAL